MAKIIPAGKSVLELTADSAVAGGRCLCRHEGKVILVEGALPGERVLAQVTRDQKRYAEAVTLEILESHARRRTPPCPHARECGGCDYQHVDRDLQLEMKRSILIDAYRRIGHVNVRELLEGPQAIGKEFGTRNRIRLSFDPAGRPGLLKRGSHEVVPIGDCLLMEPAFSELVLPWIRLAPPWRRATVRLDSQGAVVLFESGDPAREKDRKRLGRITRDMERPARIRGLLADGVPVAGKRELHFRVASKEFRADATSFFQINAAATEELVRTTEEFLENDRAGQVIDLYAGVGLFAVCLGVGFDRVIAAEIDGRAVRHLKHNLRKNRVRAESRTETAEETLRSVPRAERETLIVDPPRTGLSPEARTALLSRRPRRVLYVSCDPATGARDARHLVEEGWILKRIRAIDLFPVTAHVETVALFCRSGERSAGS